MQGVRFDIEDIERLKQHVAQAPENEIEQALDIMVNEIFRDYSGNQEELSYEEWKKWAKKEVKRRSALIWGNNQKYKPLRQVIY